jgi:hypothetical protein
VIIGLALASVVLGAGIVFATWTALGSGSGNDQAVTAQTLTVTAASSPTADLFPGGSGALQFTLANANPYAVTFTSVTYGSVTSSDPVDCPASNVTTAASGSLSSSIPVTAHATSMSASISAALTMASSAPNGCQGVTFTVPVTLTGSQS